MLGALFGGKSVSRDPELENVLWSLEPGVAMELRLEMDDLGWLLF